MPPPWKVATKISWTGPFNYRFDSFTKFLDKIKEVNQAAALLPWKHNVLFYIKHMLTALLATAINSLSAPMLLQMFCKERSFIVEHHNKVDVRVIVHSSVSACESLSFIYQHSLIWRSVQLSSLLCSVVYIHNLHQFYVHFTINLSLYLLCLSLIYWSIINMFVVVSCRNIIPQVLIVLCLIVSWSGSRIMKQLADWFPW